MKSILSVTHGNNHKNHKLVWNMFIMSKRIFKRQCTWEHPLTCYFESLTSLVFPLQQDLHSGLSGPFQVQLAEAQASGSRPDSGWGSRVRMHPELLSSTLVDGVPLV